MAYNPSVFHRELKKNYGSVPQSPTASPTDYNPSVFHRVLKNNYGSVPQSSTDYNPSVFHRELKNITRVCHNHRRNSDGVTDVYYRRTHQRNSQIPKRTHVRRVSVVQMYRRIKKSGRIFEIFGCAYQLIADGITDGI